MRLCSRPNLPPQDLAAVFNAKFDRRTENKKAPSYKLLLYYTRSNVIVFVSLSFSLSLSHTPKCAHTHTEVGWMNKLALNYALPIAEYPPSMPVDRQRSRG